MDLSKFFNLSYLFNRFPEAGFSWPMRITLLIIFLGAIVLAIFAQLKYKKSAGLLKNVWYKLQVWGWTTGIIGLTFFYFREVRAIYISARGWLLLFLLIELIWLVYIIKYWQTKIPQKEQIIQKEKEFDKWLPKKK
ncbi:hypothetical protein KKH39_00730 [Patescibacteria group bacterium]|nr:hypothetical protein [Patescibacteria group bacterium]